MISNTDQPDLLLGRMASLADPTRLRLLRLLERHELGVVDLCDAMQLPQSTVSRHLKVLGEQGWTASERQGTTNLYRMPTEQFDDAAGRLWDLAREQTDGWATIEQDRLRLTRRLTERSKGAQQFFDGAAEQWDELRGELYGTRFTLQAIAALLPSDWVVADLGCGTGQATATLANHVQRVIGVDQSEAMLAAAQQRLKGRSNIELTQGELSALPLDDQSCDAALMLMVLTYIQEPGPVLREAARVLKKSNSQGKPSRKLASQSPAKLVIVDLLRHDRDGFRRKLGQHWPGFTADELKAMIEDAGMTCLSIGPLAPEPQATGPALLLATASIAS